MKGCYGHVIVAVLNHTCLCAGGSQLSVRGRYGDVVAAVLNHTFLCAGGSQLSMKGRYGHVVAAVLNHTLLMTGGYRGSVLGDLLSLKLPPSITGSSLVTLTMFTNTLCLFSLCLQSHAQSKPLNQILHLMAKLTCFRGCELVSYRRYDDS